MTWHTPSRLLSPLLLYLRHPQIGVGADAVQHRHAVRVGQLDVEEDDWGGGFVCSFGGCGVICVVTEVGLCSGLWMPWLCCVYFVGG